MSKLYVFSIGGTGVRVIKSLTMLLAAGVDTNGFSIVPIIIDPDAAAADLTRTVGLLKNYQAIREHVPLGTNTENKFFKTEISELTNSFRMELQNTTNTKFEDYIEHSLMTDQNGGLNANHALASMLFSEKNLKGNMDVGFKGNPNVGSVVLNQFVANTDFNSFIADFQPNDRIFIISSIFGGTGASGFPLLLKNLRNIDPNNRNSQLIKDSAIGALTVLPYFEIATDTTSDINSSTFMSKTKAALSYYEKNVSGNQSVNALYYLGDTDSNKQYANHEGGVNQRNDAHLIELVGALSILDFASLDGAATQTTNGKATSPIYKEYGLANNSSNANLTDLGVRTQKQLKRNLMQLHFFFRYITEQLNDSKDQRWTKSGAKGGKIIDDAFFSSNFFSSDLANFIKGYDQWLKEMSNNVRGFAPFELNAVTADIFESVKGIKPTKGGLFSRKGYSYFDTTLNKMADDTSKAISAEAYFVELFYKTTKHITENKFNI